MTDLHEPIAIVGIGCRLPGGVTDTASLWRLVSSGGNAISPIPPDRVELDGLYAEEPATPGRIMSPFGGFVDDLQQFDARFFEMAPRQAERLDPQHRLLLETTWEALDDAGISRDAIAGTDGGVYVGMWTNEYEHRMFADPEQIDFHASMGTGRAAAAGRISYFLDLLGPSVTIDTACSSSLTAIHLACQGLRAGECDVAFAGGVNVVLEPFITIAYSQSRMMAPDGRCKFGDASANGYVRSDGAVMVALKRLSTAERDGDHVYARILGSAVTNDGRASGLLGRPGRAGQEEMLRRAYSNARVDPATVQYVEAHGTGTAVGDPVELGALGAVVGSGSNRADACLVGSVKTNIGHTEGAAGVAGLVKVVLAMQHGEVPPSLHFHTPNPAIPWQDLGLRIVDRPETWPTSDGPRRAGVSAYGISGTNAHVVLEAPCSNTAEVAPVSEGRYHVLPISAVGSAALGELTESYIRILEAHHVPVSDVCAAAARRTHHGDRVAVVGSSAHELAQALRSRRNDIAARQTSVTTERRMVFVFPGHGSQWVGMARELLATEPAFAAAWAACDAAIRAESGWSPSEVIAADGSSAQDIDIVQPLIFSIQVALAALWRSWGIEPDAVIGHSMGEVAAAHVAGALDLDDAVRVICRRSGLLRRISGRGLMAMVDLTVAEATEAIGSLAHEVSVAVSNGPRSTVISGEPGAVTTILEQLRAADVFCREINVDVASHSPQVDALLDDLRTALADLSPRPTEVSMRSTVTGTSVDGWRLDADYWASNLRAPVMFGDAVAELATVGPTAFVELSPHPILSAAIADATEVLGADSVVVASMRRDRHDRVTMLEALAALYEAGVSAGWAAVTGRSSARVQLPTYPWQRERHWYDRPPMTAARVGDHPLLGCATRPASQPRTVYWSTSVGGDATAFMSDHVVAGSAVVPATGFIELALAAFAEGHVQTVTMSDLVFADLLPIDARAPRGVQVSVDRTVEGSARCRIWSSETGAGDGWHQHAEMLVGPPLVLSAPESLDVIRGRSVDRRDPGAHLVEMAGRGLCYGAAFQVVTDLWVGTGEALATLGPAGAVLGSTRHRVAVLDGCLQTALAALPPSSAGLTFVPVAIAQLVLGPIERGVWCHARVTAADRDGATADIVVFEASGEVVATLGDVRFRRIGSADQGLSSLFHRVEWRAVPLDLRDVHAGRTSRRTWIVYAHPQDPVAHAAASALRDAGDRCVLVLPGRALARETDDVWVVDPTTVDHHVAVLDAVPADSSQIDGIVYLWANTLGADPGAGDADVFGYLAAAALVRSQADREPPSRLWLVTSGAFDSAPAQAALWGFGRVAASELPSWRPTLVEMASYDRSVVDLVSELRGNSPEQQVRLGPDGRRVARLRRAGVVASGPLHRVEVDSYRVAACEPGDVDAVRTVAQPRVAPGPGEVQIRVRAAGINFLDVLKALDAYPVCASSPDLALGAECAGVVVAVGDEVTDLAIGDEVLAITPSYDETGLLAAYATVPASLVQPRPDVLSLEQAAAVPVAYVTVLAALRDLARVRSGETVLVHSATGGVGSAAVEYCRHVGATVIATAGSDERRAMLRSLGIEHVFDSRSTSFAHGVRSATAGRGVDVVLNSLAGDAIGAGLSVLAPGGRFVEIGKRDVFAHSTVDLALLKDNRSIAVLDIATLTASEPHTVSRLLRDVVEMLEDGRLGPPPVDTRPVTEAATAFRTLARAGHAGKLVLTMPDEAVPSDSPAIRPDSTYVITGGLGDLGLAVAHHLLDRGARTFVLLGRRSPTDRDNDRVARLRDLGGEVTVASCDVSDDAAVRRTLDEVRRAMPPIRGVFHAAGVLADATIESMDEVRARTALAPKTRGAWNLHVHTQDDPLDHFVLFSSVAGILGLAGQSNYAAGNAFMDSLANHRRDRGRPARSIQWGPWAEIGLAASSDARGARLADRGLCSIVPAQALAALDLLLDGEGDDVAVMGFDADTWASHEPASELLLSELTWDEGGRGSLFAGLRDQLADCSNAAERRRLLERAVRADLASVLRLDVDRIAIDQPMKALGLDSLMALELRNRLETTTGLSLSATLVWNHPTVRLLADHLGGRLGLQLDVASPDLAPVPASDADASPSGVVADGMSTSDLEAMLLAELAAVDRLLDTEGGPR